MNQAPSLTFTKDELHTFSRRELQALCKENGLKANGKNTDMIARLTELLDSSAETGEEMVVEMCVEDATTTTQQSMPLETQQENEEETQGEEETQLISQDPPVSESDSEKREKELIEKEHVEEETVECSSFDQSEESKPSSEEIHAQSPQESDASDITNTPANSPVKVQAVEDKKMTMSSLSKKKKALSQKERFDRLHDKNFKKSEDLRSFVHRRNQVKSEKMKLASPVDPLKEKFKEIVRCSPKMDIETKRKEEKGEKTAKTVFDRLYTPKEDASRQTHFLKKGERVKSLKRLRYDPSQTKGAALPYRPHPGALPVLSTSKTVGVIVGGGAAKFRKMASSLSSSAARHPPKNVSENMAKAGKDRRLAALEKKRMHARKVLREKKATS